jgi:predicted Rossmann fold flavoprotein
MHAEHATPVDVAIVGASAAGLAAAIAAGESAATNECPCAGPAGGPAGAPCRPSGLGDRQPLRIVLLEGARKPGAKILASGGGRCNVANARVSERDFWGGPAPLIRSVLRAFGGPATVDWLRGLGVDLKQEEPTGKLFPMTDSARTVLEALLRRVGQVGVDLRVGTRVTGIEATGEGFRLEIRDAAPLVARRVILATGGRALPKSGSDGAGLEMAARLGHAIVPVTQALSPLILSANPALAPDLAARAFAHLSGLTVEARLELLQSPGGRRLFAWTDSVLFAHFGLTGPGPMNLSRHWLRARLERPGQAPVVTLGHPALPSPEAADAWLRDAARAHPQRSVEHVLADLWPARLARLLAGEDAIDASEGAAASRPIGKLRREARLALARRLARLPLAVVDARGWSFAEATAGGVDLRQVDPRTMASRRVPGLYFCGEILDVDGRIGGFNFQWAWSSGRLAGRAAATDAGAPSRVTGHSSSPR